METLQYDSVVVGAGPGGYPCAIRLGQLGKKTLCIEKENWGGVCLNVGCIPSKALITAAKKYQDLKKVATMGIVIGGETSFDMKKTQEWKSGIVDNLTSGIDFLLKSNKVDRMLGNARFVGGKSLEVDKADGSTVRIECDNLILAVGSRPIEIPPFPYSEDRILDSTKALALPDNSEVGLREILRRIEPDSRPILYDAIRQAREAGPAEVEIAINGQDFSQKQWIQVVLEVSEHASTLSGTLSNITQRHHKFSQLKSQKAQLEKGIVSHLKTVREQAHQLQGLAIQVNEVEHRERQRIAMVLHDSLQQDLVGLRYQLASLETNLPSDAKPQMKVLSNSIDDCIQRVRTMSIDLNPSVLKESGFIAAIEWIRKSMSERFGLTVQLESTLEYERLESADIEALAFQCVRELLFNVVKHAETKQAEIELNETTTGELFISVRDKGIGFELGAYFTGSENYLHFGLRNITSRIRAIGGTIDIVTKPGEGTSVNFTLPTVREKVNASTTKAIV